MPKSQKIIYEGFASIKITKLLNGKMRFTFDVEDKKILRNKDNGKRDMGLDKGKR